MKKWSTRCFCHSFNPNRNNARPNAHAPHDQIFCVMLAQTRSPHSFARVAHKRVRTVTVMAAAPVTVFVKGDPKTNTLLDCPFCHRVLLTLETKKVPYTTEMVDFAAKPQWLVDKWEGKVPVIRAGDVEMADSDKIVEWLEEQHPAPKMACDVPEATTKILPSFRGWLVAPPAEEAAAKAAFLAALAALDAALAAAPSGGPLFGGSTMNAADAALAPKLYHALAALKHWKGFDVFADDAYPRVKAYRLALAELPAFKATDYGADAIIKGWQRHLDAAK